MFVIVPFQIEIQPDACVEPGFAKSINKSTGMGKQFPWVRPVSPVVGSAVVSVRKKEVK
jgi:hypothetical protein